MSKTSMGGGDATFADAIEYIIVRSAPYFILDGVQMLRHYADDFIGCHRDHHKASLQFFRARFYFVKLKVEISVKKILAPAKVQKVLGWIFDTRSMSVSIPSNKRHAILKAIKRALRNGFISHKCLERLVGRLQWCSLAMFPGKAFIRRLERIMYACDVKRARIILNHHAIQDLRWWQDALMHDINGITIDFILRDISTADITVYTDAAYTVGMGGFSTQGDAFRIKWGHTQVPHIAADRTGIDIQFMELLAPIVMAMMFAHQWSGMAVKFMVDNSSAVSALTKKQAKLHRFDMNYLIRVFFTLARHFRFKTFAVHILGKDNTLADHLSRFIFNPKQLRYDVATNERVQRATATVLKNLAFEPDNTMISSFDRKAHNFSNCL